MSLFLSLTFFLTEPLVSCLSFDWFFFYLLTKTTHNLQLRVAQHKKQECRCRILDGFGRKQGWEGWGIFFVVSETRFIETRLFRTKTSKGREKKINKSSSG